MKFLVILALLVSCGRRVETKTEYVAYTDKQLEARIVELEANLELMQTWEQNTDSDIRKLMDEFQAELDNLKRQQKEQPTKEQTEKPKHKKKNH